MVATSSGEPVLIQPVESPVICKPYYEPDQATGMKNGNRQLRESVLYMGLLVRNCPFPAAPKFTLQDLAGL